MKVKQKKGISLIVLVITIIVMIILAAAIILSLNSSGIIGKANKAKQDYDSANLREIAQTYLTEYDLLKKTDESAVKDITATDYLKGKLGREDVLVDGNRLMIGAAATVYNNIEIGATVTGLQITGPTTSSKYIGYKFGGEEIGFFSRSENEEWQYLGIDENGNMLVTMKAATKHEFKMKDIDAVYDLASIKLNELCAEIYATPMGTARSINLDDIKLVLQHPEMGSSYRNQAGEKVDIDKPKTIGEIAKDIEYTDTDNFKKHIPNKEGSAYIKATWDELSSKLVNDYTIYKNDYGNEITRNMIFLNSGYWLANTSVSVTFKEEATSVNFLVKTAGMNSISSFWAWGTSFMGQATTEPVRPVIVINPSVQAQVVNGTIILS